MNSNQKTKGTVPVLVADRISKSFGSVKALSNVFMELNQGETVALVGDNGAGKSTLAKIFCGELEPDNGAIFLDGRKTVFQNPRDARAAGVSVVYQDLALANNLTVSENVFLGDIPTKFFRVDRRRMARETKIVLNDLGINLPSVLSRTDELSGGQRQAVAIARSVHEGGRIMILDEPTAALGVKEGGKVLRIIENLRERSISILVISHNLEHVFEVADRIVVLQGGKFVGSREKSKTTQSEIVHMITGVGSDG